MDFDSQNQIVAEILSRYVTLSNLLNFVKDKQHWILFNVVRRDFNQ